MSKDLSGKHALVCGASSGIGRAAAIALAQRGAAVTALARRTELLEGLLPELLDAGASAAQALTADLDNREELVPVIDSFLADHGPCHILVNNTGGPHSGPILEAEDSDFLIPFGRHILASHLLVRRLLPGMVQAGYGRIVNVVSISVREPIPNLGVSNTIRGAMASWAKSVSHELPPGITINNVLPGFTDTERLGELASALHQSTGRSLEDIREEWITPVPEGRLASPHEIGEAIAFLASPTASYVRGISLPVDGGRLRVI